MKTKLFILFAACVAASVLMSSCSKEEIDENGAITNGQLTSFTGGIVTEAPMEPEQIGTPEISTAVPGSMIRTSMGRDSIDDYYGEPFFWEPNDKIYVEDDNGKLYASTNTIPSTLERFTFFVNGSYTTKSTYHVYYCGTNSGPGEKKVIIAENQTQVAFNNTKHFGAVGDCGVALAVKDTAPGQSGYKFNLWHAASYLCFLPYIASQEQRGSYKLKSIEITSTNNNIAGTYDLTQTGLSTTCTNGSKTITLHVGTDPNGLLLANQTAEAPNIDNSLYVVIAPGPGMYPLKVKYTVFDTKTNEEKIMTQSYWLSSLDADYIHNIFVNLGAVAYVYSGHNYYMWDAAQNYWSGHEWDTDDPWQPRDLLGFNFNDNYPKSNADPRWYNEDTALAFKAFVNPLFTQLPNANEMAWYIRWGDAHWDDTTPWAARGGVHTGGIWLKRLSVIAQEHGKTLDDLKIRDPNDSNLTAFTYNEYYMSYHTSTISGKPADNVISKYFFLPALCCYSGGYSGNSDGCYWSSSAYPRRRRGSGFYYHAFCLVFSKYGVKLKRYHRSEGLVAQPFE